MTRFVFPCTFFAVIALALCGTSCQKDTQNNQTYLYTKEEEKPLVAIVPVINSTTGNYSWNLSDEFTSCLYYRLSQNDQFSLEQMPKVRSVVKKLNETQNPFGQDISWIKQAFKDSDFVAFLELVEHEEVLKQNRRKQVDPAQCSAELNIAMRIRVFDLREDTPRVVLQELVQDSHSIPRQFTHLNFEQVSWGDLNFKTSPLGLAHEEFAREVSSRLEDYIILASKR